MTAVNLQQQRKPLHLGLEEMHTYKKLPAALCIREGGGIQIESICLAPKPAFLLPNNLISWRAVRTAHSQSFIVHMHDKSILGQEFSDYQKHRAAYWP